MTAEEYRLRNPTLSAGKKGHNSDSEDDLKGVYEAVEDDEDVVEDDDNDDDENFDDVNDDEDSELYEENEIYAAKMRYMRDKATGFVRELTYVPEESNRMTRKG